MTQAGELEVIDEIDPEKRWVGDKELTKFFNKFDHTYMDRSKPKGPDYLIVDNLYENF